MSGIKSKKLSILAVDDNKMNLMVMKNMFKLQEYEVYYADCGEVAIEMAQKYLPDMILLDVVMPDISGFEVCRILKKEDHFKDTPVIFITAANEIEYIIQGFDAGGVDYITKPFRKEKILLRIQKHFELKLTCDQLLETNKSLQELKKVQKRLISIIGHDQRSPVGNLKMILEFMSKGIIDPTKDGQYKNTIHDLLITTDKIFSVLENLMDWTTTESGKLKYNPENIHLKDAVVSLVNLYQAGILNKKIHLNINIDSKHVVFADQDMLKTIIRNLFTNAIKYTPSEGTISIASCIESGAVKIGISDTGQGMSQNIMEEILDPNVFFSTIDMNSESRNNLGLKLCKDFIEKSQGKIWVERTPELGTTVFFTLPLKNEDLVTEDSMSLVW